MGVDTLGYFPNVTHEKLYSFIKKLDKDSTMNDTHEDYYKSISFSYRGEKRMIHAFSMDLRKDSIKEKADYYDMWWKETDEYHYIQDGLPTETQGVYVSFRAFGYAVKIIKIISYRFGGWIDENDSDGEGFYEVKKNYKQIIKEIIS